MTTILDRSASALARVASIGGPALTLALALFTTLGAVALPSGEASAKTPGSTYCFHDTCHRVRTIAETVSMVGKTEKLSTSFYDDCRRDSYNPCGLTSSGERFDADRPDNAASPVYPDGTTLLLFNPSTQRAAVVRVNNAGPYWGNRKLDVSRAAAEKLGFKSQGTAKLQVKVLKAPTKAEATYKKNRKYAPVPGYVGKFASLDAAAGGLTSVGAMKAVAMVTGTPASKSGKKRALAALDLNVESLTGSTGPKPQIRDVAPVKPDTAVAQKKKRMRTATKS
jgi:rare lipoprotein A